MQGQLKWIVAVIVLLISVALLAGQGQKASQFELVPKILFSRNQNPTTCNNTVALELFLMDPDGTNAQRLTDNEGCTHADINAALSPDGKKIVFDSNRVAANISSLVSRLFVMDSDGTALTFLT